MSARLSVILAAAVLWCGCSSVGTIKTGDGDPGLREVNRAVQGKVVHLQLKEGKSLNVVGLRVAEDSVTWVNPKANTIEALPTSSIKKLSIHKTGMGAVRGLIVGAVVGAAAGGVRASMEGDDPVGDPLALTRDEKLRIYPGAHAVYASLATTPIGAIIGARKVYRFESETETTDLPAVVTKR